ncbi:MAG: GNAT family N-acetyltransferase [Planctomycetota bacterium]
MASKLSIRTAGPGDAAVIADFNLRLCRETEHRELDPDTVRAGVKHVLSDASKGRYFVAMPSDNPGEIVGCLLITHEWSDWRNGDIWWIQSVYTRADYRGRGVFRGLYEHVRNAAREAGAAGLRLYVERDNDAALATYDKLGMHETPYRMMEVMFASE